MAARNLELYLGMISWTCCSIGMVVFNKRAIEALPLPCGLVAVQMAFASVAILVFSWGSLHIGSLRDVLRWCMVVPFFTGVLLTSVLALKGASMTAVVTFRALSPLAALGMERLFPHPIEVSTSMMVCLLSMVVGCLIYVRGMSNDETSGVCWIAANTLFVLGDRLLQRLMLAKDQNPVDISLTGITFLNNAFGILPLACVAVLRGEFHEPSVILARVDRTGLVWIACSCVAGVGMGYTGVMVQSMISATSMLVFSTANKFVVVFIDIFLMGSGTTLSRVQIMGSSLAIFSSVLYGHVRQTMEKAKLKQPFSNAEETMETRPLLSEK